MTCAAAGAPGSPDPALPDLAARRLGGMVLAANDEYFAPKENLLDPAEPRHDPNRYTDRGKEMDGWETRRRRTPGHDWCIVRLGVPGIVRQVVVDTSHFRGNHPEACSLEGCWLEPGVDPEAATGPPVDWAALLPRTPLRPDARNAFVLDTAAAATHVRFSIHPDGGVARLRLHGEALTDLRPAPVDAPVDVAAVANGGLVVDCSDRTFSSSEHLIAVGDSRNMGDGWETRRRRGPGHDWVVVALAAACEVDRVVVDTTNFKGNHPAACSVEACRAPDGAAPGGARWLELVARTPLGPHAHHPLRAARVGEVDHVRLNIFPDGGVARLRVLGRISDDGWRRWGVRRLDAVPAAVAERELLSCCGSRAWASTMAARRPFRTFELLLRRADEVWADLPSGDRREAFAAHPRIGDRVGGAWSREEQSAAAGAGADTRAALAEGNRAYEDRFGHVFLVSATGRTAEELLAALRERLGNDPRTEAAIAAEEQRRITRLRLEKLMRPEGAVT